MHISIPRQIRLFIKGLLIQASWSFSGMQTLGFVSILMSDIKDRARRETVLREQKDLFNTQPYMASYLIGAMIRLIEEKDLTVTQVKRFKGIAQGTLATGGDLFFWSTLRPAVSLLSIIITLKLGLAGPVTFLAIYNLFHLYHRFNGLRVGYEMGRDVVNIINTKSFASAQRLVEIGGLIFSGVLFSFFLFGRMPLPINLGMVSFFVISMFWLYAKRPYGFLLVFIIVTLFVISLLTKQGVL